MKRNKFSAVLLSENLLLTCIGIAFVARALHESNFENVQAYDMEERTPSIISTSRGEHSKQCTIWSAIMSYGPLVVSFVNSFVSLVIDNYLHYTMLQEIEEKDNENAVHDLQERSINRRFEFKKFYSFWKRYFSYIAIGLQWILPILIGLFMYPMGVKEKLLPMTEKRSDTCMAMLSFINETCKDSDIFYINNTYILREHKPMLNYLEAFDNDLDVYGNKSTEVNSVVDNLYRIIHNMKNNSVGNVTVTSAPIFRQPKSDTMCMKVCYIDNSKMLLYMFALAVVSYFVPITISTIILTKIHMIDTKRPNEKLYVSRELLYNLLFWTPVILDSFLSLILCSYSTNGMKTSLINTVANVYQAIKNFMNTKYFKDNTITPV